MPRDGLLTENRSHWLRTSKAGGGKHTTLELQEYTPYIGAIRAVSRVKGQLRGVFNDETDSGRKILSEGAIWVEPCSHASQSNCWGMAFNVPRSKTILPRRYMCNG